MSGSNERNNEKYKHHNENEMNRPILPMSMKNSNMTEQLKDANRLIYNSRNALNLVLITLGTSLGRHVKKKNVILDKTG